MIGKKLLFLCITLLYLSSLYAQSDESFANDIAAFQKEDSIKFPPKNAILFVGSSTFTKWKDVQNYFPSYTIINRGFGGSQLKNVMHYADKIIYPYNPKQVIIYCGENDFAYDTTVTGEEVAKRVKTLFAMIRQHLPKANIGYISIKYSPSRKQWRNKMQTANQLIQSFISFQKNAEFIDVTKYMNDANGNVRTDIYRDDMLHMKPEGYQIWQKVIEPYLIK